MEKQLADKIVAEVKQWATSNPAFEKDNPTVSAQLKNLSADSVSLGNPIKFCVAHIEGDATAVGGNNEHDYNATVKRTEAFGFTTRSFAFFDKNTPTSDAVELRNIASLEGGLDAVFDGFSYNGSLPEPAKVAEMAAKEVAEKNLKRLNLYCYSTRVNEYRLVQETPHTYSKFVAIYVDLKEPKKGKVHRTIIGFYNTETGALHLSNIQGIIKGQSIDAKTSKSTKRQNAFKIIVYVLVFGAIAAAIVYTLVTK